MRKSDKKIDNAVREVLTEACEVALGEFEGFVWLTHFANYSFFPDSLKVVCVFDTNAQLSGFLSKQQDEAFRTLIKAKLASLGIVFKDVRQHVSFDTEEKCKNENAGSWNNRCR